MEATVIDLQRAVQSHGLARQANPAAKSRRAGVGETFTVAMPSPNHQIFNTPRYGPTKNCPEKISHSVKDGITTVLC